MVGRFRPGTALEQALAPIVSLIFFRQRRELFRRVTDQSYA